MQHRVKDLQPNQRQLIEHLMGRPVADDETILLGSIPIVKAAAPYEERLKIAAELESHFDRVNERMRDVDPNEFEQAVAEAIREVRKSHKVAR